MERAEIAELFYNALINLNDLEKLDRFLSAKVNGPSRRLIPTLWVRNPLRMQSYFPGSKVADNWRGISKRA